VAHGIETMYRTETEIDEETDYMMVAQSIDLISLIM